MRRTPLARRPLVALVALAFVVWGAAFSSTVAAETSAPADPALEAMKAVAPLVGRWQGNSTMRKGPQEPEKMVGEETVESRLGGRVLVIEGKHWDAAKTRVVHHAFAILSWDEQAKAYRFRTYLADGEGGDYPFWLEDGGYAWEIPNPNGKVRFRIRIEGNRWIESGTIEREEKAVPFFEMELARVAE